MEIIKDGSPIWFNILEIIIHMHLRAFYINKMHSTLLADSLRTRYIYRDKACQEIYNASFSDMRNFQCYSSIKHIKSRTKYCLYHEDWCKKIFSHIYDLPNAPLPGSKLFEESVLDFDVSRQEIVMFSWRVFL